MSNPCAVLRVGRSGKSKGNDMKTLNSRATVETEELSVEQSHQLFDREARRLRNMPGEEFVEAYRAGKIAEDPQFPQVTELMTLLPFAEASE